MNKKIIQDERVISAKRKIQSDGFGLVWFLLLGSVLVQQFVFKAPVLQYAVEMTIWLAMTFYILIFNIAKGNDIYPTDSKKGNSWIVIQSVITGAVIAIIITIQNYFQYAEKMQDSLLKNTALVALISFIGAFAFTFVLLKALAYLNSKKQQQINRELDEEE